MAVATQLHHLEELDARIDQERAEVADIQRRLQRNTDLLNAQKGLTTAQARERELSAAQRSLESDLSAVEAKIARDQKRMYGGQIVDPRELSSLERELEHLRGQRREIEDRLLEMMEQSEAEQQTVARSGDDIERLQRAWEEERPVLERRVQHLTGDIEQLSAERESLAAELDAGALHQYQRLRVASGHAVSVVSNGVCQWCRVSIPAKDVQHARAGSLVFCTNCSRILFVA